MEFLLIGLVAALASLLTFFSGFGLGTLLAPVLMAFFPVEVAIALGAVVHLLNNLFKFFLVGRKMDWSVVMRFGLPAVVGALAGSWVLGVIPDDLTLHAWNLFGHLCVITPLKLVMSGLLLLFVAFEIVPALANLQFHPNALPVGGLLSGFFGGLSGNQGALRSAFLLRLKLSKEAFIATGIVIATLIDLTRLGVYFGRVVEVNWAENWQLLLVAVGCAFTGAYVGNKLLKKVTLGAVQVMVTVCLFLLAVALGLGVI